MKRFALSESKGHFNLFRIDNDTLYSKASIKGQAKEKEYYGLDGLDDILKPIEDRAASLIERAHVEHILPRKGTVEYDYLVYFVASLKGRTKKAANELSAFIGEGIKQIMLQDSSLYHFSVRINPMMLIRFVSSVSQVSVDG